jgi:hypothetical protein
MKLLNKFKMNTGKAPDLKKYIGKTVEIDGQPVLIDTIVGNIWRPQFYEINGEHLIGMLRFHAQMLGDKSITEQEFQDFENIDFHVEKVKKFEPPKKDIWAGDVGPTYELNRDGSLTKVEEND